ncbi:MAG: hypothetical protein HY394_02510 [Candidatus Diapherotrites archaeon]|nr:hypothetical protein [Candidatus Diapherotrites archaeon]
MTVLFSERIFGILEGELQTAQKLLYMLGCPENHPRCIRNPIIMPANSPTMTVLVPKMGKIAPKIAPATPKTAIASTLPAPALFIQ